jgi:hypothetical protein
MCGTGQRSNSRPTYTYGIRPNKHTHTHTHTRTHIHTHAYTATHRGQVVSMKQGSEMALVTGWRAEQGRTKIAGGFVTPTSSRPAPAGAASQSPSSTPPPASRMFHTDVNVLFFNVFIKTRTYTAAKSQCSALVEPVRVLDPPLSLGEVQGWVDSVCADHYLDMDLPSEVPGHGVRVSLTVEEVTSPSCSCGNCRVFSVTCTCKKSLQPFRNSARARAYAAANLKDHFLTPAHRSQHNAVQQDAAHRYAMTPMKGGSVMAADTLVAKTRARMQQDIDKLPVEAKGGFKLRVKIGEAIVPHNIDCRGQYPWGRQSNSSEAGEDEGDRALVAACERLYITRATKHASNRCAYNVIVVSLVLQNVLTTEGFVAAIGDAPQIPFIGAAQGVDNIVGGTIAEDTKHSLHVDAGDRRVSNISTGQLPNEVFK